MSNSDTLFNLADGTVSPAAFQFNPNQDRVDDSEECSVNWIDDDCALVNVASRTTIDRNTGEQRKQFKIGACKITLAQLDKVAKKYPSCFAYERAPIASPINGNAPNPYHGNLLFVNPKQRGAKGLKRQVSSVLAFMADIFISRADLDALLSA